MKKALVIVNMLFLVIIIFLACQPKPGGELDACQKLHAKDYSGQQMKGYLRADLAKEIADAYSRDQSKNYNTSASGMEDTRAVWLSLETLKQYIWQIEDTLCKQDCNVDELGLGINIYFAQYPDSTRIKEFGVDPSYALRKTVFLSATYKRDKKNIDFDPFHPGVDKCKPTPLGVYLRNMATSREGMRLSGGDGDPGVLNHGGLVPPPAGQGIFPGDY